MEGNHFLDSTGYNQTQSHWHREDKLDRKERGTASQSGKEQAKAKTKVFHLFIYMFIFFLQWLVFKKKKWKCVLG